jgi:hypothetical protein
MKARYSREIVDNRCCLYLTVDGVKHLISTSRVPDDSAPFGPTLRSDVQPAPAAPLAVEPVALPEAPTRPRRVKVTLFNLRKSVAAARRRKPAPVVAPQPARGRGHLLFHAGREFALVGRTVHVAPVDAPIGANGFRRGLRHFGSLGAFYAWAAQHGVALPRITTTTPRASQRVVSA